MTSADALREKVLGCLDDVKDPCSVASSNPLGLVEMGLVRAVEISPTGDVSICLRLTSPFCEMIGFFKNEAIDKIRGLPGVGDVSVQSDSGFDWSPDAMSPRARAEREERLIALRVASTGARHPATR